MEKRGIGKKGVGKITLYTLPHCTYCNALKNSLKYLLIPYQDINVDENESVGDFIEKKLKTESYPIIHLRKRPGENIYILSETNLEKLIDIRIFNTIEEALEILLQYYYEI